MNNRSDYHAPAIVEEATFTDSLSRLSETYPQIEDIKEAIDWCFERDEDIGQPIGSCDGYYIAHTQSLFPAPKFRFVYFEDKSEDGRTIYLIDIEEAEEYNSQ